MHASLVFDVEDPITPESDDVALWLADVLAEEGVTGTFFVTGAKARALEERGRDDVIEALAAHDVCYHSDTHSVHPTMAEYCEGKGWFEGIEETHERERAGIESVERVFDTEVRAFGRTGGSYAPQAHAALAERGIDYAYCPFSHPNAEIFRYVGAVTLGMHTLGFDARLPDDDAFAERLDWLDEHLDERAASGADPEWVGVFAAHPTRVRATEFWDAVNFADGASPPPEEWEPPALRPAADMAAAKANFRELVRFVRDDARIEMTPVGDLVAAYADRPADLSPETLLEAAEEAAEGETIGVERAVSPAEVAVGFAEVVRAGSLRGVERRDVYGPTADPPREPETDRVSAADLRAAAGDLLAAVADEGALPASVSVDGDEVGLGSLYLALAGGVRALAEDEAENGESGESVDAIRLRAPEPYPAVAREVETALPEVHAGWPIHRSDLDSGELTRHAMRQTWTLARAGPRPGSR